MCRVLAFAPQLETLKGILGIEKRCRGHMKNSQGLEKGGEKNWDENTSAHRDPSNVSTAAKADRQFQL